MNSFITTKEASERLKVSVRRVQALIATGRLPAEKIGNSFAIKEVDLRPLKERKNGRPAHSESSKDRKTLIARFAGSVKGLQTDLSTNKNHLEGLGE